MLCSRLVMSICVGFVLLTSAAGSARAEVSLAKSDVAESVGVQIPRVGFTRQDLERAREMGFKYIRKSVYWGSVEKEKGVYDASGWDRLFNDAEDLGLTVICCLYGSNNLYEERMNKRDRAVNTEAGRKGYAKFAAYVAERYKDKDIIFEIWNEPNTRTFWHWDGMHNSDQFAEEYTALVKETVPAMLEADPECVVVAGSVSNYWKPSYEWTEFCFEKGILETGIKGWSVHPYGVKTPEEFLEGHRITRALLEEYGKPNMPMVNTERGFAVKKPTSELELEAWSGGKEEELREYQAWHYVRQFMADQMCDVRLTGWYDLRGDKFGVVNEDLNLRPAGRAAVEMIDQLGDYRYAGRIDCGYALDFATDWVDGEGGRKIVVWTAPPAGESPDHARPHVVKLTGASKLSATDIYGQPINVRAEDGVHLLEVSGSPMYLTVGAGEAIELEAEAP